LRPTADAAWPIEPPAGHVPTLERNRAANAKFLTQVGRFARKSYDETMKIHAFVWPDDRIDHIARHGVSPDEVEEVCFGSAFVQRAKAAGENPVYYVLGQTAAGRYLFCVVIRFPDGTAYPVTARPMTEQEKRRYRQWKSR
jgi:hypothetical protein